jgi:hemolysin activation/secretion protein
LGQEISLADIVRLAAELTKLYHARGYTFSRVILPDQDIRGGRVVLRAVEGYISQTAAEGPYADHPLVRDMLARVAAQRPLHAPSLERELLLLQRIPGLEVRSLLAADTQGGVGALRLTLQTAKTRAVTLAAADNYGSRFIGPGQVSLLHGRAGSWRAPGQTELVFSAAVPQDEMVFGSLSHSRLMTPHGDVLDIRLSANAIEPGHTLAASDIFSKARALGLKWRRPLLLGRALSVEGMVGVDLLNSRSKFGGGALFNDRLRVLRVGLTAQSSAFANSIQRGTVTVSQGLNVGNSTRSDNAFKSRADGSGLFTKLEMTGEHVHRLTEDVTFAATVNGQYAFRSLLSSEEMGFGGPRLGRAYDSGELTGDSGISGSLETRWHMGTVGQADVAPYAFVDAAKLWERDPTRPDAFAASAGVGVRILQAESLSVNGSVAVPINRPRGAPRMGHGKTPHLFVGVQKRF